MAHTGLINTKDCSYCYHTCGCNCGRTRTIALLSRSQDGAQDIVALLLHHWGPGIHTPHQGHIRVAFRGPVQDPGEGSPVTLTLPAWLS